MDNNVTARALKAILDLDEKERESLAPYLKKDTTDLCNSFNDISTKELLDSSKARHSEVEKLKAFPSVVWAAHALEHIDSLVFDLSQIVEAGKESVYEINDSANSIGYYKMLLSAVDGIVEKIRSCLSSNGGQEDIMNQLASITDDPTV